MRDAEDDDDGPNCVRRYLKAGAGEVQGVVLLLFTIMDAKVNAKIRQSKAREISKAKPGQRIKTFTALPLKVSLALGISEVRSWR